MVPIADVAVIGAGISGLANAIMLSRLGYRVSVYERFESPRAVGSGLMIQPTGLAALERLGLRQQLEACGQRIERLHGITTRGATVFDLSYDDLRANLFALAVHRGALHGVLWAGFERSGARIETQCTIANVETRADGKVSLVDDKGRTLSAATLVIDSSGTNSPIRSWVSRRKPRLFPYGAVWTTVPDIGIAPATLAQRYVAARIMIGYLPVGRLAADGRALAAFFWSLKPRDYPNWRARFAPWRDEVVELWPELRPVLQTIGGPDDMSLASYMHFTAERLSRGNVVLTGDAAHATSPQLGQGANQGLIDAVVLADSLANHSDLPSALVSYEALRRRHVRFYQYASYWMTPFFQSDSRMLAALRDLSFNRLKLIPYLRREMVRTLAGLKTGLFRADTPAALVNGNARDEGLALPVLASSSDQIGE